MLCGQAMELNAVSVYNILLCGGQLCMTVLPNRPRFESCPSVCPFVCLSVGFPVRVPNLKMKMAWADRNCYERSLGQELAVCQDSPQKVWDEGWG